MTCQHSTRTEQDNKSSFDNISPCGHWYGCIPPGLSKPINWLLTISVHVAAFQGASHFCNLKTNLISFLGWRTQAGNLDRNTWHWAQHSYYTSEAESSGFYLQWLTIRGRPTRERLLSLMLVALWPGRVNLALFIGKSHALGACLYLNNLTTVS